MSHTNVPNSVSCQVHKLYYLCCAFKLAPCIFSNNLWSKHVNKVIPFTLFQTTIKHTFNIGTLDQLMIND